MEIIKKNKMDITGRWIFYCNPKMWAIDEFLKAGMKTSTWKVTDWQKDDFQEGQLALIRVNIDNRTRKELNGKAKLESGIYAIAEIIGKPEWKTDEEDRFWTQEGKSSEKAWRVKIKYSGNLLENPITINQLKNIADLNENKELNSRRNSSWSISKESFEKVKKEFDERTAKIENAKMEIAFDEEEMIHLENKYKDATPEIKNIISNRIERGKISKVVKEWYNYECLICKEIGINACGFKKRDGEYFIETHHFFPVSQLNEGSLGLTNLMTLCPNHHRQVHYGSVELISSEKECFHMKIDDKIIQIKKKTTDNNV